MKRIMIVLITFAVVHLSVCMEQDSAKKTELNDSAQALAIVPVSQTGSYWGSIPSIPTFEYLSDCVSSSVTRVTRTVGNFAFDTEAFRMLGWPPEDPGAQEELTKALNVYKTIFTITDAQQSKRDWTTIANRTCYLTRALHALSELPAEEGVKFAGFCYQNHFDAMNHFLKKGFEEYMERLTKISIDTRDGAKRKFIKGSESNSFTNSMDLASKQLSDEELCINIGWGASDDATRYLMRCAAAYRMKGLLRESKEKAKLQEAEGRKALDIPEDDEIVKMIKNNSICAFVEQRENFIKDRMYRLLKSRFDAMALTYVDMMILAHCLKYHTYVMSLSLQEDIGFIIREQEAWSAKLANDIIQK